MSRVRSAIARAVDLALEAAVAPSFSRLGYAARSRLEGWDDVTSLPAGGRRVLVTGANSGLGYATARAILAAGGEVLLTVRSPEKGEDTRARLIDDLGDGLGDDVGARASFDVLDLEDLASVRSFAQRHAHGAEPLDAVVHNAGAMFADRRITVDGLERTYQVHVVAPFLLTSLLLPRLTASASSRVVTVTSGGMYAQRLDVAELTSPDRYRGATAYARAKRAQVVLTTQWAARTGHLGVGFHVAHPGWASTPGIAASLPTFRRIAGPALRDPGQGADTVVWLTLSPTVPRNGQLWHDRRRRSAHRVPWTRSTAAEEQRLWLRVSRDAGIDPFSPADRPTTPGRPDALHR